MSVEATNVELGGEAGTDKRTKIYCVVPRELAPKLHDALRHHFRDDPSVEVVVEKRAGERRSGADRRAAEAKPRKAAPRKAAPRKAKPRKAERRAVRNPAGRRVGERRVALVPAQALPLPRKAHRYADRLLFVEALAPSDETAEDLDTARLITRAQAGDRESFAALYTRYFDRVYNYMRAVLDDPYEAEDATQQVFVNILEALPGYEHRGEPFRGWLFIIVRNQALTLVRKRSRLEPVDPAELDRRRERDGDGEADLRALDWLSDEDLVMLSERMPLPQRQVLLLRYPLDLSHAEVAKALGRTPDQVRALQYRAIEFLRDRLRSLGRGPGSTTREGMARRPGHAYVIRERRYALAK